MAPAARVQKVVTSGQFELDGGSWDVDNNVWLVGDDSEVVVVDAPHDADAIAAAVDGRSVLAIVLTHGHNDHLNASVRLRELTGAPIWFPPADTMLWEAEHGREVKPDHDLVDGTTFSVAGSPLRAIATPGHSPGSTCLYAEDLGVLFRARRRHAHRRRGTAPAGVDRPGALTRRPVRRRPPASAGARRRGRRRLAAS